MEITQFTYFQQMAGVECNPISVEITYGLERLCMFIQNKKNVFDLIWNDEGILYRDVFHQSEKEFSAYNFEYANTENLFKIFDMLESEAKYLIETFGSTGQGSNSDGEIEKYNLSNYDGSFYVKNENDEKKIILNNKSFVGFYVGEHEYTLECDSENNILLRSVDSDNNAWYIWLTDKDVSTNSSKDLFTDLIWSDEFDYNGKLDSNKWSYEVRNQWYNEESQATTDRLENVRVENGLLKITAKKENYGGKSYTSGRVRTFQKLDFTYGRVDIRAKMPSKAGTWPALWMLGSNYQSIDWPKCGEIDILEHAGNRLNQIQSTIHHPDKYGSGDSKVTYDYNDVSTNFHVYSLVWTETAMTFYVDDKPYHIVGNACSLPFNWDFNIIVNVAMGGTYGGSIDPNFDSDTMEVDYVRVYQ